MALFGFDRKARWIPLVAGLFVLSVLAGCGGKLNPFHWFGHRAKTAAEVSIETPSDPRPLIGIITEVRLEEMPSGALLTATGRGEAVGSWKAGLVALPVQDGVLTLEFRAWPGTIAGNARDVTVGLHLNRKDLAGLSRIVVQGATNAQTVKP